MRIRALTEKDLAFADEVRRIAGWNQLESDWKRFLALEPEGCFLAEVDGLPAGTATTTSYGDRLAWVGMVLVHPDFRRRGVGTALLEQAIRYLREEKKVACVKLDATPEGRPLYEKLGFRAEWGLKRWLREETGAGPGKRDPLSKLLAEGALDLDREVFGADRSELLQLLAKDAWMGTDRDDGSFGLSRDGSRAIYLGPITAADNETGESLTREMIESLPENRWVFWDLPDANKAATELAESLGFRPVRDLTRMWLGDERVESDPSRQWGMADFALG